MIDQADVLPPERERDLESRLTAFEAETSHQIVVLTVPTLAGEPIEDFSLRVAETWAVGHEGLDNGIVVVVVPGDREARIEVGYGLEGVVPDVIAKRVLEDRMFPRFRAGDFGGGIEAGVETLMQAARGEAIPLARRPRSGGAGADPISTLIFSSILASFVATPFARAKRRAMGALVAGAVGAGITYFWLRLLPWAALAFGAGALVGWLATAPGSGRGRFGDYSGGWSGGGGGGGFRGGGGGFGGGGASGSW